MMHAARQRASQTRNRSHPGQQGVTLIELIVVVVILGIIAAIALPNYRQYVVRSQRADATTALMSLGTAQEKFYLDNNEYADSLADLRINGTERGWYTLAVACAAAGCAAGYLATAEPVATGPQASDQRCRRFSIDDRGQRLACKTAAECAPASENDTSEECWR